MSINKTWQDNFTLERACMVCEGGGRLLYPPRIIPSRGPGDKDYNHPMAGTYMCDFCESTGINPVHKQRREEEIRKLQEKEAKKKAKKKD